MTILITGAAGLLGAHLVEILCNHDYFVVGLDNFCGSYPESVIEHPNFCFYEQDCGDLDEVTRICELHGVDTIFHTACLAHEGLSVVSPILISSSVFNLTTVIATVAARCEIKRLYNFSSMARYGEGSDRPFIETDLTKPIDPYGVSKVAAEQMLNTMSDLYKFKVCHLVPHNVFGNRGGKWNDPKRGVLYIFVNSALRKEPLLIHGTGEQKRSFSFADDVLSFIPALLKTNLPNKEILNIGPDTKDSFVSINQLAKMIEEELEEVLDLSVDIIHGDARPRETEKAWCSSSKVRGLFGWKNQKTTRQGIKEVCQYILESGTKDWDENMHVEIHRHRVDSW